MPLVVQVTKAMKLKEQQQGVTKEREIQQRHTKQLEKFQDIGVHLLLKLVTTLQSVQDGRRELNAKIDEHPLEQEVTYCMEIGDKVKENVKEFTQQYEDFKFKIND